MANCHLFSHEELAIYQLGPFRKAAEKGACFTDNRRSDPIGGTR